MSDAFPQPPTGGPGQPGYGTPPTYGVAPKTNGMAVASLVLGLVGLVACGFVTGIPAIITGFMGRTRIRESNGAETGEGLATAGIITGFVGTFLTGLAILAILAVTFLGTEATSKFESVGTAITTTTQR